MNTNRFIDTAEKEKADIIAVSALLTTSQYYMEELIRRLADEGKREKYRIAVGGGPISADYAKRIGADGYSRTASLAVTMAEKLMRAEPAKGSFRSWNKGIGRSTRWKKKKSTRE